MAMPASSHAPSSPHDPAAQAQKLQTTAKNYSAAGSWGELLDRLVGPLSPRRRNSGFDKAPQAAKAKLATAPHIFGLNVYNVHISST